ncbi:MAG TPA: hypothetical protein VGJ15_12280 [Pirellulales bacterium]|jgi:hypothetical protein
MTATQPIKAELFENLGALRNLLDLLAGLRNLSDPFGSPDGLRGAIALLLNLGTTLGLDAKWLAWLQSVLDNSQLFNIVLAIGSYLESLVEAKTSAPISAS